MTGDIGSPNEEIEPGFHPPLPNQQVLLAMINAFPPSLPGWNITQTNRWLTSLERLVDAAVLASKFSITASS